MINTENLYKKYKIIILRKNMYGIVVNNKMFVKCDKLVKNIVYTWDKKVFNIYKENMCTYVVCSRYKL